jgi:hypothetical protein
MKLSSLNRKIRSSIALPLFLIAVISMTGCEKDYNYVAPVPASPGGGIGGGTTTVSFATDIQPIFNASCNMAGCHSSGSNAPDLSAGGAYAGALSVINTASPSNSELYLRISRPSSEEGFMPEGGSALSDDKKAKILTWIQEGAQNN